MMKIKLYGLWVVIFFVLVVSVTGLGGSPAKVAPKTEKIKQVIHDSIGWALTKDKNLLYSGLAHDADFFIFNPDDKGTITGWDAFEKLVETVFMNPAFKAIRFEIKELKINVSRSGDVSWFSARLDDIGEWNGEPASWENVRWTGVLEKRDNKWVIVQEHFSFATDKKAQE